ncbi:hypothetical protein, partial [Pseudomonas syringae group genomosp. 7]|uniref:hypothetical protein n=1 Tax=Pseudomonas syringae group genomosp. 7 TaxID=251699 RepID=UPI00376FB422
IKDGILKVSGFTLDQFLRYRYVIPSNDPTQQAIVFPAAAPGSIMSEIIQTYVQGISFGPSYMYSNSPLGVDGPRETLASLYLRSADSTPI